MPHIHLLLILKKKNKKGDDIRIIYPDQVDEYICARIPPLPELHDYSVQAHQQRRLWYYVTSMMLHDCNNACLEVRGNRQICKKNFPKPYSDHTIISGSSSYICNFINLLFRCKLHKLCSSPLCRRRRRRRRSIAAGK